MSENEIESAPVDESTAAEGASDVAVETPADDSAASAPEGVAVQVPSFAEMREQVAGDGAPIQRFYDVSVTVWAELGRVTMPLGDLMQLGEGSVMKLGRPVSAPVDLMVQGVRVARGEVVVVDECFAVRIKEIDSTKQPDV